MGSNESICVIGWGRMGKNAARLFWPVLQVTVISRRDVRQEVEAAGAVFAERKDRALKTADFVFLAVPVDIIQKWTAGINKYTRPDCVIMDCCTARVAAERSLKEIKRKRFGIPEIRQGTIPVIGNPDERIAEYLGNWGCNLQSMTAEEYDRSNTDAGIAHFIGMALDMYLGDSQRDRLKTAKSGSFLLQLIEHLKSNSPATYRETQVLNAYMSEARKGLIKILENTDKDLDKGIFRFKAYPREQWRE